MPHSASLPRRLTRPLGLSCNLPQRGHDELFEQVVRLDGVCGPLCECVNCCKLLCECMTSCCICCCT